MEGSTNRGMGCLPMHRGVKQHALTCLAVALMSLAQMPW